MFKILKYDYYNHNIFTLYLQFLDMTIIGILLLCLNSHSTKYDYPIEYDHYSHYSHSIKYEYYYSKIRVL